MIKLVDEVQQTVELRTVYANTIAEFIKKDDRVVALEADLSSASTTSKIMEKYPNRIINCGIQEANMIGVAAGLSLIGMRPFVHSFAPFVSRRPFDQVFLSLGYAKLSATIIGSDGGVAAEHNGGTHMPFEDLALYRAIPNATVMEMSDAVMFEDILEQVREKEGLNYIRITRKSMRAIYQKGSTFKIGKGIVLRDGSDVTIIATGLLLEEALKAHDILKEKGIHAAVLDLFTIKPIDEELLIKYAKKTPLIVTAENHNIVGGLYSAVSECLSQIEPVKILPIGVNESFGQVGLIPYLKSYYGLTAEHIVEKVLNNIKSK
jgi:transketolase